MARIRSIKPEFPQSESMGRVSRDSRLLFIELWTLADDSGRLRGNSRMLASLLFPYDNDAPDLIDSWLDELDREDCIRRYKLGGDTYLQICNWLNHQKIDKPSPSKMPEFAESSRIVAKPREASPLDQGSRIKDQGGEGTGEDRGENRTATPATAEVATRKKAQGERPPAKSAAIWQRYCAAYHLRYGELPVDNQKTRSQLCQVVDRLGADEAPEVAAFYVRHNGAWYVKNMHQVDHLVKDAEKLRTEWATGATMTETRARQTDKTAANAGVWGGLIAEAEERERIVDEQ